MKTIYKYKIDLNRLIRLLLSLISNNNLISLINIVENKVKQDLELNKELDMLDMSDFAEEKRKLKDLESKLKETSKRQASDIEVAYDFLLEDYKLLEKINKQLYRLLELKSKQGAYLENLNSQLRLFNKEHLEIGGTFE